MFILEVKNNIEVETPRGKGRVLYITEYGMEIEKMFTVAIDESGEIWEFTNRDIRMVSNLTFGRKLPRRSPDYFQQQGTVFPAPRKETSPNSSPVQEQNTKKEQEYAQQTEIKQKDEKKMTKKKDFIGEIQIPMDSESSLDGNATSGNSDTVPSIH